MLLSELSELLLWLDRLLFDSLLRVLVLEELLLTLDVLELDRLDRLEELLLRVLVLLEDWVLVLLELELRVLVLLEDSVLVLELESVLVLLEERLLAEDSLVDSIATMRRSRAIDCESACPL